MGDLFELLFGQPNDEFYMSSRGFQMSERAFFDTWKKHGSPSELYGNEVSYSFLKDLHENTGGLFIVDHFSLYNYDNIFNIEHSGDYIQFIWKDFEKEPPPRGFEDMTMEIYNAHYIFSLCNIQKISFFDLNGHIYVLVMPITAEIKEVKKYLGIDKLDSNKVQIDENLDKLFTTIRYIKDNKIHECILHNLPFFSFLLQPKEKERDAGFSQTILMYATLDYVNDRLQKVKSKIELVDQYDFDEIRASGNVIRTIMESLVKYYSIYYGYSLPEDHYGNNLLGKLKKNLRGDELMVQYLKQEMINLANDFSHDTGKVCNKADVIKLSDNAAELLDAIQDRMKLNDDNDIDQEIL
ncbi:hypothetical protein ACDZ28_27830 [Paenibacillus sp. RS8]|uniref:hypothetical protein n=1 Tax=Paenibacillus sp. RS8 TaxID=3242681 RepID=UPI0035C1577E